MTLWGYRNSAVRVFFVSALFFCGLYPAHLVLAEEEAPAESLPLLPKDVPPLPSPSERDAEFFVTKQNVSVFHEILLAPIASWVKEGKFVLRVFSGLDFDWSLSPKWEERTKETLGVYTLDESRSLSPAAAENKPYGYPFGSADVINRQADARLKAYQILWNMAFSEGVTGDVLYGGEMAWMGRRTFLRGSRGIFYRQIHLCVTEASDPGESGNLGEESSREGGTQMSSVGKAKSNARLAEQSVKQREPNSVADIFSRDVLQLHAPAVVFGYSILSQRYWHEREDDVWMYSPVIDRSRQVLPSNRGDYILDGMLSYDDFFVASLKVQSLEAKVVLEKVLLVPFPSLNLHPLQMERVLRTSGAESAQDTASVVAEEFEDIPTARGHLKRLNHTSAMVLWNYETQRWVGAVPWLPVSVFFVPRRVWILELSLRDPYYPAGRQILVVDQESFLPVYKIVYNSAGSYQRTVMSGWLLSSDKERSVSLPFAGFVLSVDNEGDSATAFTTEYVRTFLGQDTRTALELKKLLDVSEHGKVKEEALTEQDESRLE